MNKKTKKVKIRLPRDPFIFTSLGLAAAQTGDAENLLRYAHGLPLIVEIKRKPKKGKSCS